MLSLARTANGPVPTHGGGVTAPRGLIAQANGLIVYTDAGVFAAAFPNAALEDFEGSGVPPGSILPCPIISSAQGPPFCYPAGEIAEGVVINSLGPTAPTPHPGALFVENAFFRATNSVGSNFFDDATEILLPDNTCAAGFELSSLVGTVGQVTVTAHGPGGSLGSIDVTPPDTFGLVAAENWIFVGFSDPVSTSGDRRLSRAPPGRQLGKKKRDSVCSQAPQARYDGRDA